MTDNNVIEKKFKNYKKTQQARRQRLIKIVAILAAFLTISSVVASILAYLF